MEHGYIFMAGVAVGLIIAYFLAPGEDRRK